VVCANTDCLDYYYKRLTLEGQEATKRKDLDALKEEYKELPSIRYIEDLF
jgi:hypothetical protein